MEKQGQMVPPVTHYRDEDPSATQNVVEKELEREMAVKADTIEKTPELKVLPVDQKPTSTRKMAANASNIVNAFRQKMATNATPIELPSVGKTVEFKEISTAEQKDLSKIALESNSRSDIMYVSMLGLINRLAMEKGFDIREYTEFERISITLNLQQMTKMNPEIKFTCAKCGKENSYRLDVPKMLREFNKTYRPDQEMVVENGNRTFTFTFGWPRVDKVEEFFKNYYRKYDSSSKSAKESIDNLSQIEYITMFIKKVAMAEGGSNSDDTLVANLEELTYPERVQIIDCLPQSIIFDDDTGVVSRVIEMFVTPLNRVFRYNDCQFCGAEQSGQVANLSDFLGG